MYDKHGMTLIEVISIVGIIGVLYCISVPYFGSLYQRTQNVNLEIASKELLCDLRLAQQKARSEACIYHIYFNKFDNSYMVYSYKDMESCVYKKRSLPDGIFHDNVRSTYYNNKVSFNSNGKPLPFPCTISLANYAGNYKRITITVGTDYISLKDK